VQITIQRSVDFNCRDKKLVRHYLICAVGLAAQLTAVGVPSAALASGDSCVQGYVWREATRGDHVCVTPEIRAQAWNDNKTNPNEACPRGLVWREATPQDHICVDPSTRAQAWDDNAHAQERYSTIRQHVPATAAAGDSCVQGYVWREATAGDHVCVTPAVRAQAWNDNKTNPNETCPRGLVWREATPQDHICVDPTTRAQAWDDNAHANERIALRKRPIRID